MRSLFHVFAIALFNLAAVSAAQNAAGPQAAVTLDAVSGVEELNARIVVLWERLGRPPDLAHVVSG